MKFDFLIDFTQSIRRKIILIFTFNKETNLFIFIFFKYLFIILMLNLHFLTEGLLWNSLPPTSPLLLL